MAHLELIYLLKMVILHSYLSLSDGNYKKSTQASHGKKNHTFHVNSLSEWTCSLSVNPHCCWSFLIKFSISETLVYIIEVYMPQVFARVTSCNYCNVTQCHAKPPIFNDGLYLPFLVRGWVVYYRFIDTLTGWWLNQLLGKMMEWKSVGMLFHSQLNGQINSWFKPPSSCKTILK